MEGIAFSMTTVKWADCWHSKPYRTITNQFPALPRSTLCQNAIAGPELGQSSFPIWIKDTGGEVGKEKHLALPPHLSSRSLGVCVSLSLLQSVLFFFSHPSPAFICLLVLDAKSSCKVNHTTGAETTGFTPFTSVIYSRLTVMGTHAWTPLLLLLLTHKLYFCLSWVCQLGWFD